MVSHFQEIPEQVSFILFRTENDVKNRFFSQLRMGLRHLNKAASKLMGNKFEQIKPSVLFKIISSCEEEPKRLT